MIKPNKSRQNQTLDDHNGRDTNYLNFLSKGQRIGKGDKINPCPRMKLTYNSLFFSVVVAIRMKDP